MIVRLNEKPAGFATHGLNRYIADPKKAGALPIQRSQYIRGDPKSSASDRAEVFRAGLAAHAVDFRFE
jgi:hypothetical protein